jgi:hypothetical protein
MTARAPNGGQAPPLRQVIENASKTQGCGLADLTVLDIKSDPYRIDRPAYRLDAEWVALQIKTALQPHQRIHIRGLHYAIVVQGNVRKPDGTIYRNTEDDWVWLLDAVAYARWLKHIEFDRITDNRNEEPIIHRSRTPREPTRRNLSACVWTPPIAFDWGGVRLTGPEGRLAGFDREQPFALVILGEKSSLEDVLLPIAQRYGADLYLPTGEISSTLVHQMAKDGAADGRPLVVITATDFDPVGRQIPVSLSRKLQALRDLLFPNLRFEVVPSALTREQVRELRLPSTPLKSGDPRSVRWRRAFGHEQTEIDALATLRPDVLRRIIQTALEPYYDRTLALRIREAAADWRNRAQVVIDAHIDADELEDIRDTVETIEADANERIEAVKTETDERVAVENHRLHELIAGIRLPRAPALPDIELAERPPNSVLVTTDWTWAQQTLALKKHKSYGNGEDA